MVSITEAKDRLIEHRTKVHTLEELDQVKRLQSLGAGIEELFDALLETHPRGVALSNQSMENHLLLNLWHFYSYEINNRNGSYEIRVHPDPSGDHNNPILAFSLVDINLPPNNSGYIRSSVHLIAESGTVAMTMHTDKTANKEIKKYASQIEEELRAADIFTRNKDLLGYAEPLLEVAQGAYLDAVNMEAGPEAAS